MPSTAPPALDPARIDELAAALLTAFEAGEPLEPLSQTVPGLTVDDAYAIQRALVPGTPPRATP